MNDFEKTFFKVQGTKSRLQLHFFIYHKYQCVPGRVTLNEYSLE